MSWVSVQTIRMIPAEVGQFRMEQVQNIIDSLSVSRSYNGVTYYRVSDVTRAIRDLNENSDEAVRFIQSNASSMGNGRNGFRNGTMNGQIDHFPNGCNDIRNGNQNGRNNGVNGVNGRNNGQNDLNGRNNGQNDLNGRNNGQNDLNGRNNGQNDLNGLNGMNGIQNGLNDGTMFEQFEDGRVHLVMDARTFLMMVHRN